MKQLVLSRLAEQLIRSHAADAYPLEGCGLLLGWSDGRNGTATRALACRNLAEPDEQWHRFVIDPLIVLKIGRDLSGTPESMLGFYHSHPDAEAVPSTSDMEYIRLWPETVWLIVPVHDGATGESRGWWLDLYANETSELDVRFPK